MPSATLQAVVLLWIGCCCLATGQLDFSTNESSTVLYEIVFSPEAAWAIQEGDIREVNLTVWPKTDLESRLFVNGGLVTVTLVSEDPSIVKVVDNTSVIQLRLGEQSSFKLLGIFLGYADILWSSSLVEEIPLSTSGDGSGDGLYDDEPEATLSPELLVQAGRYQVSVIRPPWAMQMVLTIILSILLIIINISMGCELDLAVIWNVLKKPVAPAIGFCSQFVFMPLGSYGFGCLFFDDPKWRMALFTLGCSPGGIYSNFWTLLLGGDLNLSITMTTVSSLAAMGMMPLWIFTLGQRMLDETQINIPYENMVISLVALTIPLAIGMVLSRYRPRWAAAARKMLKPITVICLVLGIGFGIYSGWYVFLLFTWQAAAAGMCVAWGGYIFGALLAWMARLTRPQIIAVSIETALQNAGVAFIVLVMSLPQPAADLAAVPLVGQMMVTGPPLWIAYIIYLLNHKCKKDEEHVPESKDLKLASPDEKETLKVTPV